MAISTVKAQDFNKSSTYTTALGVKFYPGAISLKHFVDNTVALEGIGSFWDYGFRVTGLYEFHYDIRDVQGLKWYIGPGVHVGFYNNLDNHGGATSFGIDGVLGLDYKFTGAPINMSLDWQPSFEFGNNFNNGFAGNWGGLGIRYTF
jgi:hypothetical protein